jgi:hypothetical protein
MNDRLSKYGYGVLRLGLLTYCLNHPSFGSTLLFQSASSFPYIPRWVGCLLIGSIGAPVNVEIFGFGFNLLLLISAGLYCVYDLLTYDYILLIYLIKTFSGDFLAGKLDTIEWKLVLFFIYGVLLPGLYLCDPAFPQQLLLFSRVLFLLFVIQFFCEFGDNYFESLTFFRHRYSFEVCTALLVTLLPLEPHELHVIQFDLFICLFYRISNASLLLWRSDLLSSVVDFLSLNLKILCFKLHGLLIGIPVVSVDDPEVAMLVMKSSVDKGYALERYVTHRFSDRLLSLTLSLQLYRDTSVGADHQHRVGGR